MRENNDVVLNLDSPAFAVFHRDLNAAIITCLQELYEGGFSSGDISAKISIDMVCQHEEFYTDEQDNPKIKLYRYRKPVIEHKATVTLKRQAEVKGKYVPDGAVELKKADDTFVLSRVAQAQMSLEETEDVENDAK